MLESLVNLNICFSHVYMDDISDMICQIYHLNLEQYFIQQQHDLISDIYVIINVYLLYMIVIRCDRKNSHH